MELLTHEQSELLRKISNNELDFQSLNQQEVNIISLLKDIGYIECLMNSLNFMNPFVAGEITEYGRQYLYLEDMRYNKEDSLKQIANDIKRQAEALNSQYELALKNAEEANKEAKFAKVHSWIAIITSVLSLLIAGLTFFFSFLN